jgi:hypothetical protein
MRECHPQMCPSVRARSRFERGAEPCWDRVVVHPDGWIVGARRMDCTWQLQYKEAGGGGVPVGDGRYARLTAVQTGLLDIIYSQVSWIILGWMPHAYVHLVSIMYTGATINFKKLAVFVKAFFFLCPEFSRACASEVHGRGERQRACPPSSAALLLSSLLLLLHPASRCLIDSGRRRQRLAELRWVGASSLRFGVRTVAWTT